MTSTPDPTTAERYACGHAERTSGCGGCDPSAIEFVRDDGEPWRRVAPAEPDAGDDERAYVVNPEAIGDLSKTPIVKVDTDDTCPMHSRNWLIAAVRNNRRLSDLPPQPCTCEGLAPVEPDADDAITETRCPTPCDPDCDVACHEVHAVTEKRDHDVRECIQRQCAATNARLGASEPLTEAEREAIRTSGSWPHVGRDIFFAVERIVAAREAAAATKARADERERIAQAIEAECDRQGYGTDWPGLDRAARIARGDA